MTCASCGFESPAGFRFCGGCGAPLAAAAPPQAAPAVAKPMPASRAVDLSSVRMPEPTPIQPPPSAPSGEQTPLPAADERRTVTILFCDISGFTAMSEKLDPEVVREIMDRLFDRLTSAIHGFGGTIDKYIGDAVMALFGAPVALGDDPERAVRAGLEMQRIMGEYSEELKRARGFGLAMRVGINTGKVIWGAVGGEGDKKFTVMGDAVNLASRLEHAAPIGGVLIGEATQRHVKSRFVLEALEPIMVKGKTEPQRVFQVVNEIRGAAAGRTTTVGPRSPFVGRDEEMAQVGGAFTRLQEKGTGAIFTLEAPVGIGKSRLLLELRAYAEERGLRTLSARAPAFGHGAPFAPWTDLFQRGAGIATLAPEAAREKLARWAEESAPGSGVDPRWLHELANVADAADAEVQRRREQPAAFRQGLLDAFTTWLWAFAKRAPLVLVAEDLHWWPAPSLELLLGAARVAHKAPLMVLASKRPQALSLPWPPDPADVVISLAPLDDAALLALAHGVLGGEVPRGLVARLTELTGGSPFFAEEMIQAFIDTGALKTAPDAPGWHWDESAAQHAQLPTTVEGLTQARIDALPPRERRVLSRAAVVGASFWEGLLESMGEKPHAALLALAARDLVHPRRSRLADEKEWTFKHATIQAVAYENHLKKDRVADHLRVAEWLERKAKDTPEFATVIADHYLRAEERPRALPFLLKAAEVEVRAEGRLESAKTVEEAVSVAEEVADARWLAPALFLRGRLRRIASHPGAESDLSRAMVLAEKVGDGLTEAKAGRDLGGVLLRKGELDRLEQVATLTLEASRRAGTPTVEVNALMQLGALALRRADFAAGLDHYRRALQVAEVHDQKGDVGIARLAIGDLYLQEGRATEAIEQFRRAAEVELSRENRAILYSNLGAALIEAERPAEAETELRRAEDEASAIALRWVVAEARARRATAAAREGRLVDAEPLVTAGVQLARESEALGVLVEALGRRAEIIANVDRDGAKRCLDEARAIAQGRGDRMALQQIETVASRLGLATARATR